MIPKSVGEDACQKALSGRRGGEGLNRTEDVNHAVTNDEGKEQHLAVQTQSILVALCWSSPSPLIMEHARSQLPNLSPHCLAKNGMIKLSKWRVKCE